MSASRQVEAGDWFVVYTGNRLAWWINFGEDLIDGPRKGKWAHAGVATGWTGGKLWVVEAEPGGAVHRPWQWQDVPHLWSTGTGLSKVGMAQRALFYASPGPWGDHGVPYSFLDYAAIATHGLHLPAPGLRQYVASTGHMICSQLVDQCAVDCDVHLFDDGRWPGYVKPSDLGDLLEPEPHVDWLRSMKGRGLPW